VLPGYLLARGTWTRRLALVAGFLVAGALTARAWTGYWNHTFTRAEAFVAKAGGQVFRAPIGTHHAIWHAIYCGLGDYGGDRGYSWDDEEAFHWATTRDPVTNPVPLPYHYEDGYYLKETYDGIHHIAPTDLPAYNRLVRARVLNDIRRHPGWYAGILGQRVLAVMRDATPAALAVGPWTLAVPGAGWLLLPVLVLALWRRAMFHALLIAFALPLSAVAVLVYSGKGMTFYGIAHLVAIAAAVDLLVRSLASRARRGAAPAATEGLPDAV